VGEKPQPAPQPIQLVSDEEAARLYGEQVYWEEYWERNQDEPRGKPQAGKPRPKAAGAATPDLPEVPWILDDIGDEDVPF